MINAAVEFPATVITSDGAADRLHPLNDGKTVGTDVGVVALHPAALEGQIVKRLFARDPEIRAGELPLRAVGIDPAAPAALVGDEVREFVLQGAPNFFGFAFPEFWIQLDAAVRPPCAACGRLHPGVPGNANTPRELGQGEGFGGLRTPFCETAIFANRFASRCFRSL